MEKSERSTEYIRLYPDADDSKGAIVLISGPDNVLYTSGNQEAKAVMDIPTVRNLFANGCLNIVYMVNSKQYITRPFEMSYDLNGTGMSYLRAWVYDDDDGSFIVNTYKVLPSEDYDPNIGEN